MQYSLEPLSFQEQTRKTTETTMRKEHTSVELVDDIDGSTTTTTIEFTVNGKNYTINRALRSVHGHWGTVLPLPSEAY